MAEPKKTLAYPADEINELLYKVKNPATEPMRASDALITSGGVRDAIDNIREILDEAEKQATDNRIRISKLSGTLERDYAKKSDIIAQGEDAWYGIEYDVTVSSPTCTRIGSATLHAQLPIQSQMRGCLLNDSGDVERYLDSVSWTAEVRDGSKGQVMVEIPSHYRMFETSGNKRRVKLSIFPLAGYTLVPRVYVSAYEASLNRDTLTLSSVVNASATYRGGDNISAYDGTYRSLLGKPVTNISLSALRGYARNRNNGRTSEWNTLTYDVLKTIYWLFVVEFATFNSQLRFNASATSNGYRQGGLGSGVTTLNGAALTSFNGTRPFISCGYTDILGNSTGVVDFTMPTEYSSTATTVSVPRYRGIEHPFGHIGKLMDGCLIATANTPSAQHTDFYVCRNPEKYADNANDGYGFRCSLPRENGYIVELAFGAEGECVAKSVGGSTTTYICDYFYNAVPSEGTAELRIAMWGGNAQTNTPAGLAYIVYSEKPHTTAINAGTRLCFIPNI